ncbi:MAG: hypothetical protein ACXVEF_06020 [Polyangiales bacterium]
MTSSSRSIAVVLALAIAGASLAPSVSAGPDAADVESARALRKEGKKLRAAKDFAGALEKFKAAYALVPTAVTGYELATAYVDVHRLIEARAQALAVVDMPKEVDETEVSAKARDDAKKLAAELAGRIPGLRVKIVGAPAGTMLTLDDQPLAIEVAAAGRKVNPGKHVVVAQAPGMVTQRADIELAESDDREIVLTFQPVAVTEVPVPSPQAAPAVPTPQPVPPRDLPPASSTSSLVYAGVAIAGTGLLVGAVTGGLALGAASDLKKGCEGTTCPRSSQSKYDAAHTLATVSTVSFLFALGGGALTVVGLVQGGPSEPRHARVTPTVGLGFVGISGDF